MYKITIIGVIAFALCGWFTLAASSDEKKSKPSAVIEHDFREKIVYVRTSLTKSDEGFGFTLGYLKNVQVRRLGDRSFLVGQVAHGGRQENLYAGSKIWLPLSVVLELGEFENMEAVEKIWKKLEKLQAAGPARQGKIH